jgi:hypothetical protein
MSLKSKIFSSQSAGKVWQSEIFYKDRTHVPLHHTHTRTCAGLEMMLHDVVIQYVPVHYTVFSHMYLAFQSFSSRPQTHQLPVVILGNANAWGH